MTTERALIEDAVVEALAPLLATAGGYLRGASVYSGDTTPEANNADVARVTQGGTPAILVATGDSSIVEQTMGRRGTEILEVEVVAISSNLRSAEAAGRGDATSRDPGAYRILKDVRRRLWRRPLTVGGELVEGVGTLLPDRIEPVVRTAARQIWRAVFTLRVDAVEAPLSDELGDYAGIDSGFNFPTTEPGAPANPVIETEHDL